MTTDQIENLVHRYLNNELNPQEIKEFEQELLHNKALADELKLTRDIEKAVNDDEATAFREQLEAIHQKHYGKRKVIGMPIYWAAAASIVLVLGLAYLFFFVMNHPMNDEKIFAQYYKPYESTYSLRSVENDSLKLMNDAFEYYDKKDYKSALSLFKKCIVEIPGNLSLHFYAGISCMETGDYAGALKYFDEVIAQNSNLLVEQAAWYKALCLLKMKKDAEAKTMFKQMAAKGGYYKQKAEEILKEMN